MDTTLCYLICLSCLPQTVHTSRDCAVLNVMGQYTVDQDTTAGCCAGRMPRIADACSSCGLDTEKCGRRCSSTDAVSGQDGLAAILRRCAGRCAKIQKIRAGLLLSSSFSQQMPAFLQPAIHRPRKKTSRPPLSTTPYTSKCHQMRRAQRKLELQRVVAGCGFDRPRKRARDSAETTVVQQTE